MNYVLDNCYGNMWVEHFFVEFYGVEDNKLIYCFPHCGTGKQHKTTFRPAAYTRRLHGNAPAGTFYGSFRIKLPNKKTVALKRYI